MNNYQLTNDVKLPFGTIFIIFMVCGLRVNTSRINFVPLPAICACNLEHKSHEKIVEKNFQRFWFCSIFTNIVRRMWLKYYGMCHKNSTTKFEIRNSKIATNFSIYPILLARRTSTKTFRHFNNMKTA